MISRRLMAAALGLGLAFATGPQIARAENAHLTKAIEELKEGMHEGRQHMYSSFAEHLHNAYDHAAEAKGNDPRGHIKVAMGHIRQALHVAKRTHHANRLAKGIDHAHSAMMHLKAANAHE